MTVAKRREVSGTTIGTDRRYRQTHTIEHFVSLRKSCRHRGLRFGGFSVANETLTPFGSTVIRTKQSSMNCHSSHCSMFIIVPCLNGSQTVWQTDITENHRPGINATFKPSIGLSHFPKEDYFS